VPIKPDQRARYPADWPAISRAIRYDRAGGRCEFTDAATGLRCTAENGRPHPITGSRVVLTVAHLNHTPEDNRDSNLRAGCQRCHLKYDAPHHARSAQRTKYRAMATAELFGATRA
jgi:hypothetical protein